MSIITAFLLSLGGALTTGLGGLAVALFGDFNMRIYDTLIGFAAGVMIAVATIGLIPRALAAGDMLTTLVGVAAGTAALFALDRFLPHEHENLSFVCQNPLAYRRGLLLFTAMTLHNIPEGLAVGTGYAAQPRLGLLLALAIALHNIPEGIAVAGPFRACGMPRHQYVAWTTASGLAEPVAALLGAAFVILFRSVLAFSLAFAGGAMLFVVSDELIPESHSHGYEHEATFGFVLGFLLLLGLSRML